MLTPLAEWAGERASRPRVASVRSVVVFLPEEALCPKALSGIQKDDIPESLYDDMSNVCWSPGLHMPSLYYFFTLNILSFLVEVVFSSPFQIENTLTCLLS